LTRYSHGKKKKELKWTRIRRGRGIAGKQKKYDREYDRRSLHPGDSPEFCIAIICYLELLPVKWTMK